MKGSSGSTIHPRWNPTTEEQAVGREDQKRCTGNTEIGGGLDLSEMVQLSDARTNMVGSAVEKAEAVIGESLTSGKRKRELECVKSESENEDERNKQSWLMRVLTKIISTPTPNMKVHKYKFADEWEAAKFNEKWLRHYRWSLEEAIGRQKGTMVHPGSEFRQVEVVAELWQNHALWPKMKEIIEGGVNYPLEDIPEEERKTDLEHMMKRGNHFLARRPIENFRKLKENYRTEVEKGWMLPLPARCLRKVRGAAVIPVGVHTQFTINEKGERGIKRRTTHDASFAPPSNKSVNQRMDREALQECFYGHCLLRVLHRIHNMRVRHPKLRILLIKLDLDAAYI